MSESSKKEKFSWEWLSWLVFGGVVQGGVSSEVTLGFWFLALELPGEEKVARDKHTLFKGRA